MKRNKSIASQNFYNCHIAVISILKIMPHLLLSVAGESRKREKTYWITTISC